MKNLQVNIRWEDEESGKTTILGSAVVNMRLVLQNCAAHFTPSLSLYYSFYTNNYPIMSFCWLCFFTIPFWEWWFPLGCVHLWWCQTWLPHLLAQWCTPPRRSSRRPGRGLWFSRRQSRLQMTQGLLGERNLSTNKQTSNPTQTHSLSSLDTRWKYWALHILWPLCSLSPTLGCLIHPQAAADTLSVWSQACSYRHDIIQFWHVWTSRLLSSL